MNPETEERIKDFMDSTKFGMFTVEEMAEGFKKLFDLLPSCTEFLDRTRFYKEK
jgi:hypothetical protein